MKPLPIRFTLCRACRIAAVEPDVTPCPWCGDVPIDCSPWGSDRREWLRVRLDTDPATGPVRAHEVFAAANYRDRADHKRSLVRGITARGNTTARLTAVCP